MDLAAKVMSAMSLSTDEKEPAREKRDRFLEDTRENIFLAAVSEKPNYPYCRPDFLFMSQDEIAVSADHAVRPVMSPKFPSKMPLYAGYAEVINAGKTFSNEDQASARFLTLSQGCRESKPKKKPSTCEQKKKSKKDDDPLMNPAINRENLDRTDCTPRAEAALFGIFDGHAGASVAVAASKCLHEHIKCTDDGEYYIRSDQLVKGALESAFIEMDQQIASDKDVWRMPGGAAAISVLVFLGKIYVANAGDCRAVLVTSAGTKALSRDLTPASDRKRIQQIAYHHPDLIGKHFSRLEYGTRIRKSDLNQKIMYRDWFMDGWAVKTAKESDLRPPLISRVSKKKRLFNTLGVARGFGDHHMVLAESNVSIKPFLSPVPEITVTALRDLESLSDLDVIIVASDGLWDVMSNEDASRIVRSVLGSTEATDTTRYSQAAQELVVSARGNRDGDKRRWTIPGTGDASQDDITAFVIPLKYCAAPANMDSDEDDDIIVIPTP